MPIKIDKFGGMVPVMDPALLPNGASQILHNYVAKSGVLEPINALGPFVSSHEEDGSLSAGIESSEVVSIPKPTAPAFLSRRWLAELDQWMSITMVRFLEVMNPDTGARDTDIDAVPLTYTWDYNETGIDLYCQSSGSLSSVTILNGQPTWFRGPRFMFSFSADSGGAHGGPAVAIDIPNTVFSQSNVFSTNTVPLFDSNDNCYAEFQVLDYSGPIYDEEFLVKDPYSFWTYTFGVFYCAFRINMNYSIPKRRHYFYAIANVDSEDREGPPSDTSAEILVRPGELVTISTAHEAGDTVKIYRTSDSPDGFLLIDEGAYDTYEDEPAPVQPNEDIPPFGNWDDSGAPDIATFLIGSVLHPGQFGVAFYGKTLYCSDVERLHAWPDENTFTFIEDIKAIALAGDTVLVFAGDEVYGVSGSDPSRMARFLISKSHPLLNAAGLCQIGNTVYWPTYDGLAACTGSQVQIVTADHFSRADWLDMDPANMWAKTADNRIYLEATVTPVAPTPPANGWLRFTMLNVAHVISVSDLNVCIDLNGGLAAVSTYDAETSPAQCRWKSKIFVHPQDTIYDLIRVDAAESCTVTATIDGVEQTPVTVTNDSPLAVSFVHGRNWQFEVASAGAIHGFEAFERRVVQGQDIVSFTPDSTPSFRDMRISYPEPQKLSACIVRYQTKASEPGVSVNFYNGHEVTPFYTTTTDDGSTIEIPIADMVADTEFKVVVDTDRFVEEVLVGREVVTPSQDAIIEARTGQIAPWLLRQYTWEQPVHMRSVRVSAATAVVMQLYYDDDTTPTDTVSIAGAYEYRVVTSSSFTRLRIRFVDGSDDPADHLVNSVIVATSRPQDVPADGIHLQGVPAYRRQVVRFGENAMFSAVSVVADAYPLYLDIYRVGESSPDYSVTIPSSQTVPLPWVLSETSDLWEFDVRNTSTDLTTRVHSYHLYVKKGVPVTDAHLRVANTGGVAPWLVARYEYPKLSWWSSYKVETSDNANVWMAIYADGVLIDTIECTAIEEGYINTFVTPRHGHTLEFRFFDEEAMTNAADNRVKVACVYAGAPEQVGGPITLRDNPWLWRQFNMPNTGRFSAAQVVMRDTYTATDVILRLYNEDANTEVVPLHNMAFALPAALTNANEWYVSVENALDVQFVTLYPEKTEKVQGYIEAHARPHCPDWLQTRYELDKPTVFTAVRVEADSYPVTVQAETDNGTLTVSVASDDWTATGWTTEANTVIIRFLSGATAVDETVRCVRLLSQQEVAVGPDGVVDLTGLPCYKGIRLRFAETGAWAGVSVDAEAASVVTLTKVSPASPAYVATASVSAKDPTLHRINSSGESDEEAIGEPTYGSIWTLDVACTGTIRSVILFAWKPEPAQQLIQVVQNQFPQWYRTRYQLGDIRVPRSVLVRGYTDMDLYAITHDGYDVESFNDNDLEDGEQRIDSRYPCYEVVLDFATPANLKTAVVAFEEHVAVDPQGVIIRQANQTPMWRNKVLRFSESGSFGVVRARRAATVKVKAYGAGSWADSQSLSASNGYLDMFDVLDGDTEWELDVIHEEPLEELVLFSRTFETVKDGLVVIRRKSEPFCWKDKRVLVARPINFTCMRVVCTGTVVVQAYDSRRDHNLWAKTVTSSYGGTTVRLPRIDSRRDYVFDITPASEDTEIEELALATSMEALRRV